MGAPSKVSAGSSGALERMNATVASSWARRRRGVDVGTFEVRTRRRGSAPRRTEGRWRDPPPSPWPRRRHRLAGLPFAPRARARPRHSRGSPEATSPPRAATRHRPPRHAPRGGHRAHQMQLGPGLGRADRVTVVLRPRPGRARRPRSAGPRAEWGGPPARDARNAGTSRGDREPGPGATHGRNNADAMRRIPQARRALAVLSGQWPLARPSSPSPPS